MGAAARYVTALALLALAALAVGYVAEALALGDYHRGAMTGILAMWAARWRP